MCAGAIKCEREETGRGIFCLEEGVRNEGSGPDSRKEGGAEVKVATGAVRRGRGAGEGADEEVGGGWAQGGCVFPVRSRLLEARDVYELRLNVTIVAERENDWGERPTVRPVGMDIGEFCRHTSSLEWPECDASSSPKVGGVGGGNNWRLVEREYVAKISCGFIGFAPRTRKELLEGVEPEFGGVPLSATHAFRHQPYVGAASTQHLLRVDSPGGGSRAESASVRHFERLALGMTTRGRGGTSVIHQVLTLNPKP